MTRLTFVCKEETLEAATIYSEFFPGVVNLEVDLQIFTLL